MEGCHRDDVHPSYFTPTGRSKCSAKNAKNFDKCTL